MFQGMMQKNSYKDFAVHKQAHDEFVAKLSGLSAPLDGATVDYAKNW